MGYDGFLDGDETVTREATQMPCGRFWTLAPFLGQGLCWVWLALTSPLRLGGLRDFAMLACACTLAIAFRRLLERPAWFAATAWGSGALGSVATALLLAGAEGLVAQVAPYAMGVSNSLIMLLWTQAFARRKLYVAGLGLSVAYAGGSVVYLGLAALPAATAQGASITLPLLSVAFLQLAGAQNPVSECPPHAETGAGFRAILASVPWRIIAVLAVFCFAAGASRVHSTTDGDMLAMGVSGCAIAVLTVALSRRHSPYSVYRVFLPVMMGLLLLAAALGRSSAFGQACVNLSYACTGALLLLYLCDAARRFCLSAVAVYAVGRLTTRCAFFAGNLLSGFLLEHSTPGGVDYAAVLYVAAAFAVAVAVICWLAGGRVVGNELQLDAGSTGKNEAPTTGGVSSDAQVASLMDSLVERRCAQMGEEYRLSPREVEVLALLAWGKNARRIEEVLGLSANTVKTHVRHIYTKMGVHTRAELDALLDIRHAE